MKTYFLTAGGTGGHLFPAQALAEKLNADGCEIHLVTESRTDKIRSTFPAKKIHLVPSATLSPKRPIKALVGLYKLVRGYFKARALLKSEACDAIIGFGGYPTIPLILAGAHMNIPIILHEANSVIGRANKLLSKYAWKIAVGFHQTKGLQDNEPRMVFTGNPVRENVLAEVGKPYLPSVAQDSFHLLVFGGSQGARFFADMIPEALSLLEEKDRKRIQLVQQCRPEDMARTSAAYYDMELSVELQSFFADLPQKMVQAHLVISRSGAMTVAELTALGRPSILVPLPGSLDQDQYHNATRLMDNDAAIICRQEEITAAGLAQTISELMNDPARLTKMAEQTLTLGELEATSKLADCLSDL